jgi:hypothetical protein
MPVSPARLFLQQPWERGDFLRSLPHRNLSLRYNGAEYSHKSVRAHGFLGIFETIASLSLNGNGRV